MAEAKTAVNFKLCPKFEKTFGILGKKWNGLIIEVLLNEGPQRFKDLSAEIAKCSDRVLVERLRELEAEGLVTRQQQADSYPLYQLTPRGKDLKKVMAEIHKWAEKWYSLSDCQH